MLRTLLVLMAGLAALVVLGACAKATPTATPATPTAVAQPTLLPTVPAIQFPKGDPAPGLYKTYEEARKDWPNTEAAARKEGKLLVSTFTSAPAPGTWFNEAMSTFSTRYGITVEWLAGSTAEQLARLGAEKVTGNYSLEIWPTGPQGTRTVCAAGFCESFVTPNALEPGVPWLVNPLAEGVHLSPSTGGLIYYWQVNSTLVNTDLVPPEKYPKSFKDLEDPWFKGKIAMDDARNTGPPLDYMNYAVLAPQSMGLGERHIKALLGNVARLYPRQPAVIDAVVKGDQAIAPMIATSGMFNYVKLPQPWNWTFPQLEEEGQMGWVLSSVLFKKAPHPNAAKLLADFLISKEVDTIRGKYWGVGVGRADSPVLWPGTTPKKIFPVDYGDVRVTTEVSPEQLKKVSTWLSDLGF